MVLVWLGELGSERKKEGIKEGRKKLEQMIRRVWRDDVGVGFEGGGGGGWKRRRKEESWEWGGKCEGK